MTSANLVTTAVFLSLFAQSASADRVIRVEPGVWEYSHTLTIPGLLAPISTPQTECITADDAERNLSDLLGQLSADAACNITNLKDNLNTVTFDLVCSRTLNGVALEAAGQMSFRYARTSITGSATGEVSIGGVATTINAQGQARKIGRCEE